ncbi:MAG: DUF1501 domain-containing protein [Pirellula sp.]|nr:DUF1501 domain-containing protein [Pirellula sp.]
MTIDSSETWTRRQCLEWSLRGLGATAAWMMLSRELSVGQSQSINRPTARAKRAIQICLVGGLSHLDSWDYKPSLIASHGKSLQTTEKPDIFFGKMGLLRKPDWEFQQRGESGIWTSELFPHLAQQADQMTIIRSMVTESANHTPALFFENSGFELNGFPSVGSWLSYGLGTINENLPAYVVLPDGRGGPMGGASNWTSGFLPGEHQGVVFQSGAQPVRDLGPHREISREQEASVRSMIELVNRSHLAKHGEEDLLLARIKSYELAARMQLAVPDVSSIDAETQATRDRYGVDQPLTADMGRRCLLGRRLLEQGVRFVQIYSGGPIAGSPRSSWDAHESVLENHAAEALRIDQPVAALLEDLEQRGMLEDTLVLFTTEFGRTPFAQSDEGTVGPGRDHNRYAFSVWMAGAGIRRGTVYGESDEIGWKVAENPVTWHDLHATLLHLFGIDHEQLVYYHNGIHRRLTGVAGDIIHALLT